MLPFCVYEVKTVAALEVADLDAQVNALLATKVWVIGGEMFFANAGYRQQMWRVGCEACGR